MDIAPRTDVSCSDVADVVRKALAERHVWPRPAVEHIEFTEVPRRNGGTERMCTLRGRYEFAPGGTGAA